MNVRDEDVALLHPGCTFPSSSSRATRFNFLSDLVSLPGMLIEQETHRNNLIVLFNGAVNRDQGKDPRDVFQRRTWSNRLNANLLYLSDPTLNSENQISIGWGQGSGHNKPLDVMVKCTAYIQNHLHINNEDILFYGSSAGGFQATYAHAFFPGSTFLVNNAQFDWTKYYPRFVQEVADYAHGGMSIAGLVQSTEVVTNVLDVFLQQNARIKGSYLVNLASSIDYQAQLSVLKEFLDKRAHSPEPLSTEVSINIYSDKELGHMPLPKERTLSAINSALNTMNLGRKNAN